MQFALSIVSLFPGGGLQRDCVEIARRLKQRGHAVTIFAARRLGGDFADDIPVRVLEVDARTNHFRQYAFGKRLIESAAGEFDLLVGFDKLSGLDVLYCSDRSTLRRSQVNPLLNLFPRYRQFIDLERACFAPGGNTSVLLLSEAQLGEYSRCWHSEPERLTILPPTLLRSRRKPDNRKNGTREKLRAEWELSNQEWVWLSICSQPQTKGLDRIVRALPRYSDARLIICGLKSSDRKSKPTVILAKKLGVYQKIVWLGHREDIPEVMSAADLFVHPARIETTGTALLEAIVNGLPVVASARCGYANHVRDANAGLLIEDPYTDRHFMNVLDAAHDRERIQYWSNSGAKYGLQKDLYDGHDRAADLLVAKANARPRKLLECEVGGSTGDRPDGFPNHTDAAAVFASSAI